MMMMLLMSITTTMLSIPRVHGWVLPPPHQQHPHQHPRLHLQLQQFRSATSSSSASCLRAASTDDEGNNNNINSNSNNNKPKSLSDAERKDLVDALFKGSSVVSSNANAAQAQAEADEAAALANKVEDFLDKPFFDPDAFDEDDDSFLGRLANFVKNDYELFEAVFVACFFLLLITIAKDLLRAQMVAQGVVAAGKMF